MAKSLLNVQNLTLLVCVVVLVLVAVILNRTAENFKDTTQHNVPILAQAKHLPIVMGSKESITEGSHTSRWHKNGEGSFENALSANAGPGSSGYTAGSTAGSATGGGSRYGSKVSNGDMGSMINAKMNGLIRNANQPLR